MGTSVSFQDWIAPNGITQLRGAAGSGKTTIMADLQRRWKGRCWTITPELLEFATGQGPTLELLIQILRKLPFEKDSLLVLDDTRGFRRGVESVHNFGGRGRMFKILFDVLVAAPCTTVISFTSNEPIPKVVSYGASVILDLVELVQTEDGGVVVEVCATKSRQYPAGTLGRLWVRPTHGTPVRAT